MAVIDLAFYRRKREIESLERRMSELVLQPHGTVNEMKKCFKEWLKKSSTV